MISPSAATIASARSPIVPAPISVVMAAFVAASSLPALAHQEPDDGERRHRIDPPRSDDELLTSRAPGRARNVAVENAALVEFIWCDVHDRPT